MRDLGINSGSIDYEVALEILGQSLQPFIMTIQREREKPHPSKALIAYCKARMAAIGDLQEDLRVNDRETIERILNPQDDVFGPRIRRMAAPEDSHGQRF
ncbi:MAG: antitoxin [Ottowia sp.]|uniref:antitoxin n=1 Tax=Ottowia sp. TaxID=1898956 RepID=UPI0039E389C0